MKQIIIGILMLVGINAFGQAKVIIKLGGPPTDTSGLSDRINTKQNTLVSGSNIKTVNSTDLTGPGNINISPIPTPEADFFGSVVNGNNGYSGSSKLTARKTLRSLDTAINASTRERVKVALEGGNIFEGTDGIALNRGGIDFTSYNRDKAGKYRFPILLGTDVFNTGWTLTGTNTYSQSIPNTITISLGYAWMYVIEIDTALERLQPLTARRYLNYLPNTAAVDTTPNSYYCPSTLSSSVTISIHTADGLSPNNNTKYRYEVVTRDRGINRNLGGDYGPSLTIEKLFAMDYGQGTGGFASREDSFYMYRSIVMGNTTHQGVYGNFSTVSNCAFIAGDKNIDGTSIIFYKGEGANETNTVQNSYFIDNQSVLYSHTSHGGGGGINHGRLNFYNNYVFNTYSVAQTPVTVDTLDLNYCYVKNSSYLVNASESYLTFIRNSVMDRGIVLAYNTSNLFVDNSLYLSQAAQSTAIIMLQTQKLNLQHSILHMKTTISAGNEGGRMVGNADTSTMVTAKYNILIGQAQPGSYVEFFHANNYAGMGMAKEAIDYNVYIMVSGNPMWKLNDASVHGGDPSITSFASWKTYTGLDAHSIFIDLRNYEGDLKRVFIDPDAGNYNLTDSPQADSIRAVIDVRGVPAGMRTPLVSFVGKPSREQVVDNIENDIFTPVSQYMQLNSPGSNYQTIQRMTTTERTATYPYPARHIFDTTTNKEYVGDGTSWNALW